MLHELSEYLSNTALNHLFANTAWMVPAVQTIHILGIAIVLTTLVMLDVRVLWRTSDGAGMSELSKSFLPWTWSALSVLLASGLLLVVAEPARELWSVPFQLKMLLVILLALNTVLWQRPLRADSLYWSGSPGRRRTAAALAGISLTLCMAIVAAGRLIAYVNHA